MASVLERGNIYFVYRPKVEHTSAAGLEDIQRFFVILSPFRLRSRETRPSYGGQVCEACHRLLVIGRKKLPAITENHERNWGFVQKVAAEPEDIETELDRLTYSTATRGERHLAPARPAGEGVYVIARHDDHTHLAFALELPERPGEVQEELNIPREGSYIITVKNPDVDAPPDAGLPEDRAELPPRLRERFHGRRFIPVDPPDFLDREGAEFVLIGADEDVFEELGVRLDSQHETLETAELFNDLRMERSAHPLKPLLEGRWQ
jgi:hypothetical protein